LNTPNEKRNISLPLNFLCIPQDCTIKNTTISERNIVLSGRFATPEVIHYQEKMLPFQETLIFSGRNRRWCSGGLRGL